MKFLIQKLLQFSKGTHKQKYWTCSDKKYCPYCKYASEICMYGEEEKDLYDKTPCVDAWLKYKRLNKSN